MARQARAAADMQKKRAIFEDVDSSSSAPAATPRYRIGGGQDNSRKALAVWLAVLLALVIATVISGGLTRIADAGLAITEWKPVTGALPPLNAEAWEVEFSKYKEIPEYSLQNKSIGLSEFKYLYWWEWGHRQIARLAGIAWLLGFGWFAVRRKVPPGWTSRLLLIGVLGGAQAAIGWWMVSSGLQGRMVDVASYWLALHLSLAFAIIALISWSILKLARSESDLLQSRRASDRRAAFLSSMLIAAFFLQLLLGALVAGIDAGQGFPTWPLMNGEIIPSEAFGYEPLWTNVFENPALAQFNHRIIGYAFLALAALAWFKVRRSPYRSIKNSFAIVAAFVLAQVALGISTAVSNAAWGLAALHQIAAVILLLLIVQSKFSAIYPKLKPLKRGGQ